MKTFQVTMVTLLLGTLSFAMASDSMDAEIAQINEAPTQERVKLMNEFKLKLSTLSSEEREEAITKLQTRTQTKAQIRERVRVNQAEQTESMKRAEQMNQYQGANQMMQQNNAGSNTQMFMGKK
ncbi:MAG: hypothetical protein PHU40_06130 [Sulfurimonas sp.]|nr:hypothetical protein [Sulfurimonas sp.]